MSELSLPTSIISSLSLLLSTRYIYASALMWPLWEIIVTFDDEVNLLWSQGLNSATCIFYMNRYGVPAMLILLQYISSGVALDLNLQTCQTMIVVILIGTTVSSALVNGYMSYHYLILWDRHRRVAITIVAVFFMTYIPATALALKSAVDYHKFIAYSDIFGVCYATQQPPLMKGFWSFLVWFDTFAMAVVVMNALNRPHQRTSNALKALWGDGMVYFGALLLVRIGNLICVTRLAPENSLLQLFHVWAFISILLSRFIFRVERMKYFKKARVYVWDNSFEAFQMRNYSNPQLGTP